MCIYYINREDLTYESAEHILMAGIGGMKTLPKEYVSTQFNNDISKIEQEFLRESLISLPRQFLGPGKRGSLNPKYQSRSKVHLLRDSTDSEFSLGYMQKGTPYLIPQFKLNLNNGEIKIIINNNKPDKSNAILDNFHRNLQNPETLQIKRIIDNRLPENIIFFGIQDGIEEHFDSYTVQSDSCNFSINQNHLKEIAKSFIHKNSTDTDQFFKSRITTKLCYGR